MRTAYHETMETVLLLFLLMTSQNGQWKQSLEDFLKFYRENRELIQMVAGGLNQSAPKEKVQNAPEEQPKSRPEEVGSWSVLEDFLKSNAV